MTELVYNYTGLLYIVSFQWAEGKLLEILNLNTIL